MTFNLSNGLAGLSLLSGQGVASFGLGSFGPAFETRAARIAKAQFTLKPVTPPWREAQPDTPLSAQVSAIKRMATIIDQVRASGPSLPPDVQTAFTTYKALDRLRMLAETALKSTTSAAERSSLQTTFAKGMADLQSFLAGSPTDKLTFAFAQASRRVESVVMAPPVLTQVPGEVVVKQRADALTGLTGAEQFKITLSKPGVTDSVTVNLAGTPQPPTLDSVAAALNAAIASVPMRNADGTLALDTSGNTQPRWAAKFVATKMDGGWGLTLSTAGIEQVSLDQIGAGDSLMVATGQTLMDAPTSTGILRFDDPAGAIEKNTLLSYSAVDRLATEAAKLLPQPKPLVPGEAPEPIEIMAATRTRAMATDAQGNSYLVGTTAGDLGANVSDGQDDLFLTKVAADGTIIWQRSLGAAGPAQGAAVSIAANGDVVVAGTVSGTFNGAQSDGDMLVARFAANGDEKFATLVRAVGADEARAVAVGADGSIYVGGRAGTNMGDAFVARLDASGRLQERRSINSGSSDAVNALAIDSDGSLVALTSEGGVATLRRLNAGALSTDIGSVALGSADARALAIAADGTVAVAGATLSTLNGAQVNGASGGRDGFVTRIDRSFASLSTTYVGSAADDQVDSVAFMGGAVYLGGRTAGSISGTRMGPVDGFITRVDAVSGAIQNTRQFGQTSLRTEAVRVTAAVGSDTVLGALGLRRGTLNPDDSAKLTAQTALRAGDEFSFRVDGGTLRKITVTAEDTLVTLADRVRRLGGANISVTTPLVGEGKALRIEAKAGHSIDLIAGAAGKDALGKMGLAPARLVAAPAFDDDRPRVTPGGSFGLELSAALNLNTAESATVAFDKLKNAISMTQTAFRSLYWDENKADLVNGTGRKGGRISPYQQAQLGRYQAALDRLSSPSQFTGF